MDLMLHEKRLRHLFRPCWSNLLLFILGHIFNFPFSPTITFSYFIYFDNDRLSNVFLIFKNKTLGMYLMGVILSEDWKKNKINSVKIDLFQYQSYLLLIWPMCLLIKIVRLSLILLVIAWLLIRVLTIGLIER